MDLRQLLPYVVLAPFAALFFFRLAQYVVLRALGRDAPRDREMLARGESLFLGRSVRQAFSWSCQPIVSSIEKARVHPNSLTILSLIVSLGAGLAIALGDLALGGVIGLLGSLLDYLDGRIARSRGLATRAGSFLDSTIDRYCDVAFLGGAAVFFRHTPALLTASILALGSSLVISYTRAKAESLGAKLEIGLMQRPERVVVFCLGALFSPLVEMLLPPALAGRQLFFAAAVGLLALAATVTAVHRTVAGFRALGAPPADDPPAGAEPGADEPPA